MDTQQKPNYDMMIVASVALLAVIVLYNAGPLWESFGMQGVIWDTYIRFFSKVFTAKGAILINLVCLLLTSLALMLPNGTLKHTPWSTITVLLMTGGIMFLTGNLAGHGVLYVLLTLTGYGIYCRGCILLSRQITEAGEGEDLEDTFLQCERKITNKYSVNIPTRYRYNGKIRHGWINILSPQRGIMVIGIPGSGKSHSVYGPLFLQMPQKGYTMFVYDYKFPELTTIAYNELLDNYHCYKVKPKMYIVNFDDPERSHRFNPISPEYLTRPADCSDIAELIMYNACKLEGHDDFFTKSAICYVDLLIWFLKIYDNGKYCTFPHMVQLMAYNYIDVFEVIQKFADEILELQIKMVAFVDAIRDKAKDQLQGQLASARIPLAKFCDPGLAWILTGNDFNLKINDPKEPKFVAVGNNPKRKNTYGTALALLTSRMFTIINEPGNLPCGVLIDEFPTIYLKDIDQLQNTGRSNGISVVMGAQDKSQIIRDYKTENAEVLFNTVGNMFSGAVKGRTAEDLSKSFGTEKRPYKSVQSGDTGQSVSISYQDEEIMPRAKIEALSQGTFCGYVSDTFKQKIKHKTFCGEIVFDHKPTHNETIPQITYFEGPTPGTPPNIDHILYQNQRKIHQDIKNLMKKELGN